MTKNGTSRTVPLSREAMRIIGLMSNKEGQVFGLAPDRIAVLFMRLVQNAAIDDLHFHDSRHKAVTRLARKLSVLELARVIGHKNLSQLMTYIIDGRCSGRLSWMT